MKNEVRLMIVLIALVLVSFVFLFFNPSMKIDGTSSQIEVTPESRP